MTSSIDRGETGRQVQHVFSLSNIIAGARISRKRVNTEVARHRRQRLAARDVSGCRGGGDARGGGWLRWLNKLCKSCQTGAADLGRSIQLRIYRHGESCRLNGSGTRRGTARFVFILLSCSLFRCRRFVAYRMHLRLERLRGDYVTKSYLFLLTRGEM